MHCIYFIHCHNYVIFQLIMTKTDLENQKTESQVKLEAETTRLQAEIDNLQMV